MKFLDAQIKTDETYFHTFVGILRNEPAYSVLVKKLETAYDSEFVCFVPPLTYRPLHTCTWAPDRCLDYLMWGFVLCTFTTELTFHSCFLI